MLCCTRMHVFRVSVETSFLLLPKYGSTIEYVYLSKLKYQVGTQAFQVHKYELKSESLNATV